MATNKGIVNKELRKVLNENFKHKPTPKDIPNYGITTVNEDLTLGLVAIEGTPLKKWNNPNTSIDNIKLDFTNGKKVVVTLDLLKKAIKILETQGKTATLLIEQNLPIVLKTGKIATIIAPYNEEGKENVSAQDEWKTIRESLDQIKITEAL